MQQNIEDTINAVLQELEKRGLEESTVNQYRRGLFRPIIRHFNYHSGGEYDSRILEKCREKYQDLLERGNIKRHHFQSMIRALAYIKSYAETGEISFSRLVNTKQFLPSEEAITFIKNALVKTDLKDDYKNKLDCILRKLFCFLEERGFGADNITVDIIREFIKNISGSNAGSMGYVSHSLKILLDYLSAEKIICGAFDISFITPRSSPKKIIAPFTEKEVSAILSHIDISTAIGKRDYAIIILACGTGLRGIDIVNLKLSDVHWKIGEIRIAQSKTGVPITSPITGQIRNAMADYILNGRKKSDSQNVFLRSIAPFTALRGTSALDGVIDNLCIRADVPKKPYRSFHSLRRSFGTWLANEGIPITTIFQLLGHQDLNSSKPYLSFDDEQMLRCAIGFEDIPLKGGVYA